MHSLLLFPMIPMYSGLPVAVLRYRVSNPGLQVVKVGIAFLDR